MPVAWRLAHRHLCAALPVDWLIALASFSSHVRGVPLCAVLRVWSAADVDGVAALAGDALRPPLAAQLPGRLWGMPPVVLVTLTSDFVLIEIVAVLGHEAVAELVLLRGKLQPSLADSRTHWFPTWHSLWCHLCR